MGLVDDMEETYYDLLYDLRSVLRRLARNKVNTEEIEEILDCLEGYLEGYWIINSEVEDGILHLRVVLPSTVKYYRLMEKIHELMKRLRTEWKIEAIKAAIEKREIPEFDISEIKEEVERLMEGE